MQTRFFSPDEMFTYFETGKLRDDLSTGEVMAICSIADLLNTCETYKKGAMRVTFTQIQARFQELMAGPVKEGIIQIINLEADNLASSLFKHLFKQDESGSIDFWQEAINRHIPPIRSIRYLTVGKFDHTTWWSAEVYQAMEDYHLARGE